MAADASIYGLIRPQPTYNEIKAQSLQRQGMEDERTARQMQLKQMLAAQAEEEQTREAYRQAGGDPAKVRDILYQRGLYKPAQAVEKTLSEREKAGVDIGKTKAETFKLQLAAFRDLTAQAQGDQDMPVLRDYALQMWGPDAAARVPDRFDPQWQQAKMMDADKTIAAIEAQKGRDVTVRGQDLTAQTTTRGQDIGRETAYRGQDITVRGQDIGATTARRGQDITLRGQNLTDARSRETIAQGSKAPPGYRWTADGGQEPIPGGPADEKTNKKAGEVKQTIDMYVAARDGLLSGLEGSVTGPVAGRMPAVTTGQQVAEGGVSAMAPVLKQLFRVAGEGTFTDRDQALLLEMVPTRADRPEARKQKMANIDNIVAAKLGAPVPKRPPPEPTQADIDAELRRRGVIR